MKKRLNISTLFLTILFLIGIIFSIYKIIIWKSNIDTNNKIKSNISKKINIIKEDNDTKYNIDFNSLKEENSDTVGYIKVNNTNIDYVVVKGKDNSYYLNHNFNKKVNVHGWIFADYRNNFDENDKNIIIYGHNSKNGSMFGTLKKVLTDSWQNDKNNLKILLVTEKGQFYYQVFSTYTIEPESYYISTNFTSSSFDSFLTTIKNRSNHNYNVDVDANDKILTLSSCYGKKRVVLHAKLIY